MKELFYYTRSGGVINRKKLMRKTGRGFISWIKII